MASADPILTALARLEDRLVARMDERLGVWQRELQLDLDGRFDAVHHRLDRLEQEYEMIKAGLARLESDVGTLKSDGATLKNDVGTLQLAVARIEQEIASLRATTESLALRLEHDRQDRGDLRDQVVEFGARLSALESRVGELEGRLPRG